MPKLPDVPHPIYLARRILKMSQVEFAKRIGCSRAAIQKIEGWEAEMSAPIARAIKLVFGIHTRPMRGKPQQLRAYFQESPPKVWAYLSDHYNEYSTFEPYSIEFFQSWKKLFPAAADTQEIRQKKVRQEFEGIAIMLAALLLAAAEPGRVTQFPAVCQALVEEIERISKIHRLDVDGVISRYRLRPRIAFNSRPSLKQSSGRWNLKPVGWRKWIAAFYRRKLPLSKT